MGPCGDDLRPPGGDDDWFYHPHRMTQKEERALLSAMAEDYHNDRTDYDHDADSGRPMFFLQPS